MEKYLHRLFVTIILLVTITSGISFASSTDVNSILGKWNAVVVKDVTNIGEIEGRIFIGGNYNVSNSHQFGFNLAGNPVSDIVFAVGGSVTTNGLANIKVFYGSAAVGNSVSSTNWFSFQNGGSLSAPSNWAASNSPVADLKCASDYWKTLTANSNAVIPSGQPSALKFNCAAGASLAVFNVTDTQTFENSMVQQIELNPAAATQTIIINVKCVDGNLNWAYGNMVGNLTNNTWRSRVIWNFYTDANNGELGDFSFCSGFGGTVVAPTARITTNSNIDGNVVCETLNSNAEIHITGWNGSAPNCSTVCYNKVGSYVWRDSDADGIKDAGEAGIQGVVIELVQNSSVISATTSTADGSYNFSNLANGSYTVRLASSNFATGGVFYNTDQVKWYTKGSTSYNTSLSCNDNLSINFGYYKTCIGVTKTADKTNYKVGDKIQYTIKVENCGDIQLHGGVDVFDDMLGWKEKTSTTSASPYHIDVINPGEIFTIPAASTQYTVKSTDCGKLTNTVRAEGHPVDGSAYVNAITSVDVTIDCKASIGDKVWIDANKNGLQDNGEAGKAGVTVNLYTCANVLVSTTTTNADGKYLFSDLTPGDYYVQFTLPSGYAFTTKDAGSDDAVDSDVDATGKTICTTLDAGETDLTWDAGIYQLKAAIGDKVWIDANKNGLQDNGEAGKAGVTVKLFTCANALVGTTTTDADGKYLFSDLIPGEYYVQFVLPNGYVFTTKDAGSDDAIDSDVDAATGKTICTTLDANETDLTWDAGIYAATASLGDKVWIDVDKNGLQDNSEQGMAGVTVKLYTCDGTLTATTTTDADGKYLFSNLVPASYYVVFVKPAGYLFTTKDAGSDDAIDSDVDASTGKTICTDLIANESDLTWDAGLYPEPVVEKADLKIEKLVNKTNPSCGENVTYTIKVTNLGPNSAKDVLVNDQLPVGVVYVSSSASTGTYSSSTGLWSVGTLANGSNATLTITVKVDCGITNSNINLGAAKDFNLFVLEDLNQPSSDTQGKVAVGNNAFLSNYSVGDQLASNSGDVLVVGNNLSFTSGDVFNGNVVYGNATNLPEYSVTIAGTLTKGSPIDFATAKTYLQGLSTSLSSYAATGTTKFEWGTLTLTGTNATLNVFTVSGSDLSAANDLQIDVPSGSVVLVNISGANVSWMGGLEVKGTAITNVLFNFYQATNISLTGINVTGSILAPFAALNYNSGVVNGQVICKSMTGNGQFNLSMFLGSIPSGKTITNVAAVTSSTTDEVLTNNIASASFTINGSLNGGTTAVNDVASMPKDYKLAQNYPNPFNPSTVIEFSVPASGNYTLKVYDVVGREVATLINSNLTAGTHRATFNANGLASGMYIYSLTGSNVNLVRKMLLTK